MDRAPTRDSVQSLVEAMDDDVMPSPVVSRSHQNDETD
jgi:hypothetical protein